MIQKKSDGILFLESRGNQEILNIPSAGIAGSRNVTDIGLQVTEEYVNALAAQGINIISGHARGVDMAAHRAAIAAGGVTTVVPPKGLNGFRLHKDLQPAFDEGRVLILSPFPPDVGFARWMPIKRNQFIAQIANAMLVVESGEAGGTFRSGEAARALKRPLFVILYGETIASAAGNRYFLNSGARPVGRTSDGRPDLRELLATVAEQHATGNKPVETEDDGTNKEKKFFMANDDDRRLIEDYLPIEAISKEASREKSVRKGHISTLHLWWARRPLVACRAAVYGALVPADRFRPVNGPEERRDNLTRANAAKFVERLCQYPGSSRAITEAEKHILEAHAKRLSKEKGQAVTAQEIRDGKYPRPRVLDMFAGGGAIPLEALRLGCESHALDLNPVAHIIQLCTLVYPQKYGKPDPATRGMTGPKNDKGETTWGGLVDEVRYWGEWVLEKVKAEIGDLYPLIPDPEFDPNSPGISRQLPGMEEPGEIPPGFLRPVAYLWTRTVNCKNPSCEGLVPLLRQTWLAKKKGRLAALKITPNHETMRVRFQVVKSHDEAGLGFDPSSGAKGGNATCPFCGTVADSTYVKSEGCAERMGQQMMAAICTRPNEKGKIYISADQISNYIPDSVFIQNRIDDLLRTSGSSPIEEIIENDAKKANFCILYGLRTFGNLFTNRQMICLLTFADIIRKSESKMKDMGIRLPQA